MELKDIQNLIKFVAKSGASEVKLETDDFKITIKTGAEEQKTETVFVQQPAALQPAAIPVNAPAPVAAAPAADAAPKESAPAADDSKYVTIKSPIIGTFYRKPSPDKPSFAEVGKKVAEGDVLCIIEAMKLFNEIESEVSGTIVKILVEDSSPVEFDQPLFLIDPS